MNKLNTNDLVDLINDFKGQSSSEIAGFVKATIQTQKEDNAKMSDNVDKMSKDNDVLMKFVESTINKQSKSTNKILDVYTESATEIVKAEKKQGMFYNVLRNEVKANEKSFMSLLSKDEGLVKDNKKLMEDIAKKINDDLGDDKMDDDAALVMVEGYFKSMQGSQNNFLSGVTGAMKGFFENDLTKSVGSSFDKLTNGQLSVITSSLGAVGGAFANMESFTQASKDVFEGIMTATSGHFNTVMGDVKSDAIDPIMDVTQGVYNTTSSLLGYGDEDEDEKIGLMTGNNTLLGDLLKIEEKRYELEHGESLIAGREDDEKSPFMKMMEGVFGDIFEGMTAIGIVLFTVGATIGGLVGAIIKPFEMIVKTVQTLGGNFGKIGSIASSLFTSFKSWFMVLDDAGKVISGVMTKVKWLQPLMVGFAKGFSKLAWPLTILMGAIDLFKGFFGSNEDTFLGKVKDGLIQAVLGFIELPVKMFGWIVDKVLGLFGVEGADTGNKIMAFLKKWLGTSLGIVVDIFNGMIDVFTSQLKILKDAFLLPFKIIGNIIGGLWDLLTGDFEGAMGHFKGIFTNITDFFMNTFDNVKDIIMKPFEVLHNIFERIGGFIGEAVDWIKNKISKIPFIGKLFGGKDDKVEENNAEIREDNTKDRSEINEINQKIMAQKKEILEGDTRDWKGRSRESIIEGLEKKKKNLEGGIDKRSDGLKPSVGEGSVVNGFTQKKPDGQTYTMGYGKMSDVIQVGSDTLTYNYSPNQRYKWTMDELKQKLVDLKNGEVVSFGTSFIPKDNEHLNPRSSYMKEKLGLVTPETEKPITLPTPAKTPQDVGFKSLVDTVKRHEGYSEDLYRDSEGYWTGGYGTLISNDKSISKSDAETQAKTLGYTSDMSKGDKQKMWEGHLNKDLTKSQEFVNQKIQSEGITISDQQRDILSNMTYNLGQEGVTNFTDMWGALKSGDRQKAADEMVDSKWYGQVGNRSKELVAQMRSPSLTPDLKGASEAVIIAKAQQIKKQQVSQDMLAKNINKSIKDTKTEKPPAPIVINNTDKHYQEAPENVELASITMLNTSWGYTA